MLIAKPAPNWSLLPGSRQSESLIDNGGGLGQQPIVSAQNRVRSVEGYGAVNRWRIISWGLPPAHKWWDRDFRPPKSVTSSTPDRRHRRRGSISTDAHQEKRSTHPRRAPTSTPSRLTSPPTKAHTTSASTPVRTTSRMPTSGPRVPASSSALTSPRGTPPPVCVAASSTRCSTSTS